MFCFPHPTEEWTGLLTILEKIKEGQTDRNFVGQTK